MISVVVMYTNWGHRTAKSVLFFDAYSFQSAMITIILFIVLYKCVTKGNQYVGL